MRKEPDGPARKRRSGFSLENSRFLDRSLILLLPLVALEAAVFFIPLIYVLNQSFYDWEPGAVSTFLGWENYTTLFGESQFWQVVSNQGYYLLGLPLWVLAPLLVAYMLRERVPYAGAFRTIYFIPTVMSPAIVGLVFRSLLQDDGPINASLRAIGLGFLAQPWLTDANLVKPVIIVLVLWAGFGTGVLIFSAALSAAPQEQFEAARLDGAGYWKELWYIAVPAIRPTIALWTLFQVVSIFLFMFSWVYVLTNGGPGLASTTMDFFVYQTFITFGFFGAAAAQSVVLVAMIVVVALVFVAVAQLAGFISGRRNAAQDTGR
ncbi:MAG TPA: sugar ABC transporter permease [Chloroflexota bacterium]|nr:sugar ABC transporter permease [Chloroflexota bacterium]